MKLRFVLPALIVLGLLLVLGIGLTLKPGEVPSPLIGKPAPALALPHLSREARQPGAVGIGQRATLVNFWASWCTPCLVEHPLLMELSARGDVRIVGINYKDQPDDARRWLARHGDPYVEILADSRGSAGLDWGVYGVPETFVVDAAGTVVFKQIGPLTRQVWVSEIAPRLGLPS